MKKILGLIIIFFVFWILLASGVQAADLNVECFGTGSCSKSGTDPLFSKSSDGYWLPGIGLTKTINLKNSSSETKEIAIKATRTSEAGILENVMMVNLAPIGGSNIYSGSLANFYGLDSISLGNLDPGQNKNFNLAVNMAPLAGNEYQDKKTVFDLTLGFLASETTSTNSNDGGGGGDNGGGGGDGRSGGGNVFGASTGTGGLFPTGGVADFTPGPEVLGEATLSGQVQGQQTGGEVAGISKGVCQKCLWWPILLGEFAILVTLYWFVLKKHGSRKNYFFSIIIPIVAYLVFLFLNKNCFSDSFFCRYFWLLDAGLFIVFIVLAKSWKDLTNPS